MTEPELSLASLRAVATGLSRPESVLCLADGGILTSHAGAGACHIAPDGTRRILGRTHVVDGEPFVPNGLALLAGGDLLISNMGKSGGLWRLRPDGSIAPELRQVDGRSLPATNFVLADGAQTWISVSTRQWPITRAFAGEAGDGFIVLRDADGARIVADGLCFANEVRIDAGRTFLYVAETFAHRVSRYPLTDKGLGPKEIFADLGVEHYPDGMAFDVEGGLWIASIISNRLVRIAPTGAFRIMLDDSDADALSRFGKLLSAGAVSRDDVQAIRGTRLANVSCIAFGGPNLRTIYLGSLSGDTIFSLPSPVRGLPPVHWRQGFDL